MTSVLGDEAVRRMLPPDRARAVAEEALRLHAEGRLTGPVRAHAKMGAATFASAPALVPGRVLGFRAYCAVPGAQAGARDQITAVYRPDGTLRGIVVGKELGVRRMGALGALAVDRLAASRAATVGVLGTGAQAWGQLWGVMSVRSIESVRIYGRTPSRRAEFACRCQDEFGVQVDEAEKPQEAAAQADIVIVATRSQQPVLEADWLAPGSHVTSLGPRRVQGSELSADIAERAEIICTDSIDELRAIGKELIFADALVNNRVASLYELGRSPGRALGEGGVTLFLTAGIPGVELLMASELLRELEEAGREGLGREQ
jgi:alanine dehydrogenase